jgi:hypothetical protein
MPSYCGTFLNDVADSCECLVDEKQVDLFRTMQEEVVRLSLPLVRILNGQKLGKLDDQAGLNIIS